MEHYYIAFIIAMLITFWTLYDKQKAGFMGEIYNPLSAEYIVQPKIIHNINLPQEW